MKRPIIFSPEMVAAILDGRKTQTRRVLRSTSKKYPQSAKVLDALPMKSAKDREDGVFIALIRRRPPQGMMIRCRFGGIGQQLYVRETWHTDVLPLSRAKAQFEDAMESMPVIFYKADTLRRDDPVPAIAGWRWRPSIHLPQWASRLTLITTKLRAQRVQEISEADAKAEGMTPVRLARRPYRFAFQRYWDLKNKKRGFGWDKNPLVWAITFSEA